MNITTLIHNNTSGDRYSEIFIGKQILNYIIQYIQKIGKMFKIKASSTKSAYKIKCMHFYYKVLKNLFN